MFVSHECQSSKRGKHKGQNTRTVKETRMSPMVFSAAVKEYLKAPCLVRYSVTTGKIMSPFHASLGCNRASICSQPASKPPTLWCHGQSQTCVMLPRPNKVDQILRIRTCLLAACHAGRACLACSPLSLDMASHLLGSQG